MSEGPQTFILTTHRDERGTLRVLDPLPFVPLRMFTISESSPESIRGQHAHKNCRQLIYCTSGSVKANLTYCGQLHQIILARGVGVICQPLTWIELHDWYDDAQCIVLADKTYETCKTITELDEFYELANDKLDGTL